MQQTKNRWLIALAAIGIHISIGSVYAFSVLTKPVMAALGCSLKDATWAFSLAILFLGTSAGFLGTYVERFGPRRSGLVSMCFFVTGMLGTAWAVHTQSLALMYIFYGVIGGIGLGIGYITPVSTLVKWFPKNRGLATGLAIMGFGFASLIAGPVMQLLIASYGLVENFVIMGCVYAVVMTVSALYLAPPVMPELKSSGFKAHSMLDIPRQYTAGEAMRTWQFYLLWWVFFTNITCGIGLLAVASPMAQEVIMMSPLAAASMVGVIGLLNGGGRIVWSTVSDYIGRPNTYIAFFTLQIVAFYLLAGVSDSFWFQALIFLIITCYGGGFSCMPAYLSDIYGTKQLSAIHGRILTAWGLAGLAGPLLLSAIYERTHSYSITLYFFSACFVLSLVLAVFLKMQLAKKEADEKLGEAAQIH